MRGELTTFDRLWLASILWKINTIIFVPVFFHLRRFRILAVTVLVVAVTTLPYFLIFPAHLRDFLANNFGNSVTGHELGNLGFRQLVFELLAALGASASLQRLTQLAVVAIVLGVALLLTFPRSQWRLGIRDWTSIAPSNLQPRSASLRGQLSPISNLLSLWLVTFFLVSPQIWEHHSVMLLPALVVAYWQKPDWRILLIWLLLALPTPFGFIGLQPVIAANYDLRAFALEPAWQPLLQHASKAIPTLLFFLYLALTIRKRPAGSG